MIDLNTYRMRIGCFHRPSSVSPRASNPPDNGYRAGKYHGKEEHACDRSVPSNHGGFCETLMGMLYIIYGCLILVGLSICQGILVAINLKFDDDSDSRWKYPSILPNYNNRYLPCLTHRAVFTAQIYLSIRDMSLFSDISLK